MQLRRRFKPKAINSEYTISQPVPIPGSDPLQPRARIKLAKEKTTPEPKSTSSEQEDLAFKDSHPRPLHRIPVKQASTSSTSFVARHLNERREKRLERRAKIKGHSTNEQLGFTSSKPIPIPTAPLTRSISVPSTNRVASSIATFAVGGFMNSPERKALSPEFLAKVNGQNEQVRNRPQKSKPLFPRFDYDVFNYDADDELSSPAPSCSLGK